MSRAREARHKAQRRQFEAATTPSPSEPQCTARPRRLAISIALVAAIAILLSTGAWEIGAGHGISRPLLSHPVSEEVSALLANVPQRNSTLGLPTAPITLQVFADLECPEVRRFVVSYLPSIINTWVRRGVVKLEYRSLETDTSNLRMFTRQEIAALAAGRQNEMWNFVLTFVHEQIPGYVGYGTDRFVNKIGAQVPSLNMERWRRDRANPHLFTHVVLDNHLARTEGFRTTPSFLIGRTRTKIKQLIGSKTGHGNVLDASTLGRYVAALG